jgi:hypothetical protein
VNLTSPQLRRLFRRIAVVLVALALGSVWPKTARADNIDERLLREATTVLQSLKDRQYRNVGILKFQVKKGDRPASLDVGLLNANLATRLENALILVNDVSQPLGIVHNASLVVASGKNAGYLDADARKKLFDATYPLAWGKERVSVDAFLTGVAQLDRDFRKTTVVIQVFDRKNPELQEIARFTVDTDRSILSDVGESFALIKRGDDADEAAIVDVTDRNEGKPKNIETVESILDLELYYDGQKQTITTDGTGNRRAPEPGEGKRVQFKLRNKTQETLALVLRINGVNTLGKEGPERQVDRCTKWVLRPGQWYSVNGFYLDDNKVEEFKVVSPGALTSLDPRKMGLIEVAIFRKDEAADPLGSRRITNLRGLSASANTAETFKELQQQVFKSSRAPALFKGLIVPGETKTGTKIEEVKFTNLTYAGSMTIRYWP